MRNALIGILLMTGAMMVQAQPRSEVRHESDHFRVLAVTLSPRQSTAKPVHGRNRVLVFLDSGKLKLTSGSGATKEIAVKPGDVRWVPAEEHLVAENDSNQPLGLVEVEVKGAKQPKVSLTDLDPIKVDPKHWSLAFENEIVRVARVQFGPLENGQRHQHVRNYVVVYINDQAKGKRGDITPHLNEGTTTHSEGNPLDRAVQRIAVELK